MTDTSAAAYQKQKFGRAAWIKEEIGYHLNFVGPATCDELQDAVAVPNVALNHIRPRITELKDEGKIKDSGDRRELKSGCKGIVWCAVPGGSGG